MKATRTKALGWSLILFGVLVVVFRERIVFPGLERLFGIETIVGKDSVVYLDGGGYAYTNPGALIRWISSVGAVGILVCVFGIVLLFRARRHKHRDLDERVHTHVA